jgi:hypothetical protein
MLYPEIRSIASPDLEPPALPADPSNCAISFRAFIGPKDGGAATAYDFTVVTPTYLARALGHTWGRGFLIVDIFDWTVVVRALAQLLAQCSAPTWDGVLLELDRELRREQETSTEKRPG